MSNRDDSAVAECCSYCRLYQIIGLEINRRSRLVKNQDLGLAQQGSSQADQLPLSDATSHEQISRTETTHSRDRYKPARLNMASYMRNRIWMLETLLRLYNRQMPCLASPALEFSTGSGKRQP